MADHIVASASDTTPITVNSETALNAAIGSLFSAAPGQYTIELTGNINLTADLVAVSLPTGVALTIDGNAHTIDGGGHTSGFFVFGNGGTVTFEDLTIADAVARGGAGTGGGGGGAGLGGGLFVGDGAVVTLIGVSFFADGALGGAGGAGTGGHGGDLNGFVQSGDAFGSGGLPGGPGGFGGGGGGGNGAGGAGGFGGGGGGVGGGGGLGAGGDIFVQQGGTLTIEGGSLGLGRVFGGASGGNGNFGPGRAYGGDIFIEGDQSITVAPPSGQTMVIDGVIADEAGSHDPSGLTGRGGVVIDGLGAVVLAATDTYAGDTTIESGRLSLGFGGSIAQSNSVALATSEARLDLSAAGDQTIQNLSGVAGSIVWIGGNTLTIDETASSVFAGTIVGSSGELVVKGAGTLTLSGANTYRDGTTIIGGTLDLAAPQAAGSGAIKLSLGSTLTIDNAALSGNAFANTIVGFGLLETIELTGLAYTAGATAAFDAGKLSVTSGGTTDVLTLSRSQVASQFELAPDGGGIAITGNPLPVTEIGSEATLNTLIQALSEATPGNYTIELTGNIDLTGALQNIDLPAGTTVTIDGAGHTVRGESKERGFFVDAGSVVFEDLSMHSMVAQGGAGAGGGGGGAGLGGGLFVGANGSVTLIGVNFSSDAARGGDGGGGNNGGGGGGLNGGVGGGLTSGDGGFGGGGGGGTYGHRTTTNPFSTGGFSVPGDGGNGGAGGFGGGGGGGGGGDDHPGDGGKGGFGGGGGGVGGGGGGGLGAGGDIFVQQGGTLTIEGGHLGAGIVSAGAGGGGAQSGLALGGAIFLQGNQTVTLAPPRGQTLTISSVIAGDDSAYGALAISGSGTVVLEATGTYLGGTTIAKGATLEVAASHAAGNRGITVDGTLEVMSGGTASRATITSGGAEIVDSGGGANRTTIESGGNLYVRDGGAAGSIAVTGGSFYVSAGGTASGATIGSGGSALVYGEFDGAVVENGGSERIFDAGKAARTIIAGGLVVVSRGGTASVVTFDGGGTLQLDASVGFADKIADFAVPDRLDLRDIAFGPRTTLSFAQDGANGVLTATDGSHTARLALAGSYVTANFTTASDGNGGTLVEIAEPQVSGLGFAVAADQGPAGDTITVTGTGVAGNSVTLFDRGTAIGQTEIAVGGAWTITTAGPLSLGTHSLSAGQSDPAGGSSPLTPPQSLTVRAATPNAVTFVGTAGTDRFIGGAGNDLFQFTAADLANTDIVNGGAGVDQLNIAASKNVFAIDAGGVSGIETYVLGDGAGALTLADANFSGTVDNKITVDGNLFFVSEAGVAATDRVVMNGGAGGDHLIAGSNAVMTGGAGTHFELTTPGSPGSPDTNRITNFTPGVDLLQLDSAGFDLGANPVAASLFTTGAFTNSTQRFAYSASSGRLYYNAAASGGGISTQLIVTLTGHPALTAADIIFG